MYAPFRLGCNDYLVRDRISDLYRTARELHAGERSARESMDSARTHRSGRTRWSIGRLLTRRGSTAHAGQM